MTLRGLDAARWARSSVDHRLDKASELEAALWVVTRSTPKIARANPVGLNRPVANKSAKLMKNIVIMVEVVVVVVVMSINKLR